MANPLLTAGAKNGMLDQLAGQITHLGIHSAWPGATGTNELAGGSPAYARQAVLWDAAAAGSLSLTGSETFDIPAGSEARFVGGWDALTVGNFKMIAPIGNTISVPFAAEADTDAFTSKGHGLTNGTKVVIVRTAAEALPTGITEGDVYFVVGATTDTFQVSLTEGGAAVDITADGNGYVMDIVPESFGAQGTLTISEVTIPLDR